MVVEGVAAVATGRTIVVDVEVVVAGEIEIVVADVDSRGTVVVVPTRAI